MGAALLLVLACDRAPIDDADQDGYTTTQGDCDDQDPAIHPGAPEGEDTDHDELLEGDGRDGDCDGIIDEGTDAYDDDGDGLSERDGDCDDRSSRRHPGAQELCDGRDDDCDGHADDRAPGETPCARGLLDCAIIPDPDAPCDDDADCPEAALCSEGLCTTSVCAAIPSRAHGEGGDPLRRGAACDADSDCAHGSFCDGGLCARQCQADQDCPGEICTPRGLCGACAADADCQGGERCTARGQCLPPQCQVDADCEASERCDEDRQCSSEPLASGPEGTAIDWISCADAEPLPGAQVVIPRGASEAEVCFRITGEDPGSLRVAALASDASLRPDAAGPIIELAFPDDPEATQDEASRTWTLGAGSGQIVRLAVRVGDTTGLGPRGSSPVVRATTGQGGAELRVWIPGTWGGAYAGRLMYDRASTPDEAIGVIIQPGDGPVHPLTFLALASPVLLEDLGGELQVEEGDGTFSLTFWQTIDLPALTRSLGEAAIPAPIDRPIYRQIVLSGADQPQSAGGYEGAALFGTFTETIRGLTPSDLVREGRFVLQPSQALERAHPEATGAAPDAPWREAPDQSGAFAAGALKKGGSFTGGCDDTKTYKVGTGAIPRAECLLYGSDPQVQGDSGCEWTTGAYPLGPWLDAIASGGAAAGDAYASQRFAADGICSPELDLWGVDSEDAVATLAYAPQPGSEGALIGACASGDPYVFTPTDRTFEPCCIDVNRVACSAQNYAVAGYSAPPDAVAASLDGLWSPLAALVGAHAYALQDLRARAMDAELSQSSGQPARFDEASRLAQQAQAVGQLNPVLSFLLSPAIATAIDQARPADLERCRSGGSCNWDTLLEGLGGALAAHEESLDALGAGWYAAGRADDLPFITAQSWLEGALVDRLLAIDPGAPAPSPDRLAGLAGRAQRWRALALGDRTPWGVPRNAMPNIFERDFEDFLLDAQDKVTDAAQRESELLAAREARETTQAAETAALKSRRSALSGHLADLCGKDASGEPVPASTCGTLGKSEVRDDALTLDRLLRVSDDAQDELERQLKRISIKEGEAAATMDVLTELLQSYDAHHEDLMAALDEIEADYMQNWEERFNDWQADRAELRAELEEGYAALGDKLRDTRNKVQAQRVQAINQKCESVRQQINAQKAALTVQCDKKVATLQQLSEARVIEAHQKALLAAFLLMNGWNGSGIPSFLDDLCTLSLGQACFNLPVAEVALVWLTMATGDRCDDLCRDYHETIDRCELKQRDLDGELERATAECAAEEEKAALDARLALAQDLWQQEKEMLLSLSEYKDERLEQWYQYRQDRMTREVKRQEDRALQARAHADDQSGVVSQMGIAQAAFTAELELLMVDLTQRQAIAEQAIDDVNEAGDHLTTLATLAESLEDELEVVDLQIAAAQQPDPSFRVVEGQEWLSLERDLEQARQAAWRAIRTFEIATSQPFASAQQVYGALTSRQLCDLMSCLEDDYYAWSLDSIAQAEQHREISARESLGMGEGAVDASTGHRIRAGDRFGQFLADPAQRRFYAEGEDLSHGIQIQGVLDAGEAKSLDPAIWDSSFCNERIVSIQAAILCEHCSEAETVVLRLHPSSVAQSHACDDGALVQVSSGEPLPAIHLNARIFSTAAGGGSALSDAQWAETKGEESGSYEGLPAIVPEWVIEVVPASAHERNASVQLEAIDDILIRINYADRSPSTLEDQAPLSASCGVEAITHYNADPWYVCD